MPKNKKTSSSDQDQAAFSDDRVSGLCQVVELQQDAISILRKEMQALELNVTSCCAELLVLKECLVEASLLSSVKLSAQMHRRKFAGMRAKHGFVPEAGFGDILRVRDVAMMVCRAIGTDALLPAGAACQAFAYGISRVAGTSRQRAGSIYICGGQEAGDSKRTVEGYSTAYGEWEALPPMLQQRRGAAAGIIGEKLYICGGHDGERTLSSVECFHLLKRTWEAGTPMLMARSGAGSGVIGKRIFVCGGSVESQAERSVECFDEDSLVWAFAPSMLEARAQPATAVRNDCLVVCGGYGADGRPLLCVEQFLPHDGAWEALPPMLEPRGRSVAGAIAGKVYVCGGRKSGLQCYKSMECLEQVAPGAGHRIRLSGKGRQVPDDYDWSEDPLCPGEIGEVLEVDGNQAYILGPREEEAWYLLEHIETLEWAWSPAPAMTTGRVDASGVCADGFFYVFGGWDGKQRLRSAERFDPASGTWEAIAPMLEQRMLPVAAAASSC